MAAAVDHANLPAFPDSISTRNHFEIVGPLPGRSTLSHGASIELHPASAMSSGMANEVRTDDSCALIRGGTVKSPRYVAVRPTNSYIVVICNSHRPEALNPTRQTALQSHQEFRRPRQLHPSLGNAAALVRR